MGSVGQESVHEQGAKDHRWRCPGIWGCSSLCSQIPLCKMETTLPSTK